MWIGLSKAISWKSICMHIESNLHSGWHVKRMKGWADKSRSVLELEREVGLSSCARERGGEST